MKILEIRDNGGKTFDRYSVIYDAMIEPRGNKTRGLYEGVGMSAEPFHPRGFGQHGEFMPGKHLGKKITFKQLPVDCQKVVLQDLAEGAN